MINKKKSSSVCFSHMLEHRRLVPFLNEWANKLHLNEEGVLHLYCRWRMTFKHVTHIKLFPEAGFNLFIGPVHLLSFWGLVELIYSALNISGVQPRRVIRLRKTKRRAGHPHRDRQTTERLKINHNISLLVTL